ncbi:MAG: hypothetical protein UX07_C0002G0003 [Parcubacteria group bacterium GW2011_GWA2_45_30]|nr:MAG: hypothetical protein UX07_C0002G0003 [Parcubacteria group bacterium GW2011_GWA2_45_30]
MALLFPFLAAVLQAASFTLDKAILSLKRVNYKTYTGVSFPLILLITLAIFLIVRPPVSKELFYGNLPLFLVFSIVLSLGTNLFFYRALDHDHLNEIQTLDLFRNIPIILFSSIWFADEQNFSILIPALVASLVIVWSHWGRNHFRMARRTLPYFLWMIVAAPLEAAANKTLLMVWHPIVLGLAVDGVAACVLGPLFFREEKKITWRVFLLLILTNLLTTVAWLFYFYSYQRSGIIYTVLLFSLMPFLVYLASIFFLRETFHWKKFAAFLIVLGSIAAAQIMA